MINISGYAKSEIEVNLLDDQSKVANFDHMSQILLAKNVPMGEIFLVDNDENILSELARFLIENDEIDDLSVGVLFRLGGHTTALCYRKLHEEIENSDWLDIIHLDSIVFDCDEGDEIRGALDRLASVPKVRVFSLGYDSHDTAIRDFRRQFDNYSCATFALNDIDLLLRPTCELDLHYYEANSIQCSSGVRSLLRLPPDFMTVSQCAEGIRRPIVDALNARNLKLYNDGLSDLRSDEADVRYFLGISSFTEDLSNVLFDLANAQLDIKAGQSLASLVPDVDEVIERV